MPYTWWIVIAVSVATLMLHLDLPVAKSGAVSPRPQRRVDQARVDKLLAEHDPFKVDGL